VYAAGDDLSALFDPTGVAVVGASDDRRKWGHWLAVRALRAAGRREVHLVNRRGGEVLGRPAHRSLLELPGPVELAVLSVPAAALEQSVDDAIAAGARAIGAITGGEHDGDAGGARDAAIAARVRAAGVRLLGPNCLGVFDAGAELELVSDDLPRGAIGLISQSGNLALEIGSRAAAIGLGFSRFASLGNQVDLQAAELVRALASHEPTRLIALYAEDLGDGRGLAAAADDAGKPVLLLTVEHSAATVRAARSHTGALVSDALAVEAACAAAGIRRVRSPRELVDTAEALLRLPRARGRRVAVLADGGGHGGLAAGLAHAAGMEVPALGTGLVARLRADLPAAAAASNPVDMTGGGEQDVSSFGRLAGTLLDSGEVDAVLLTGYFGGYADYSDAVRPVELAAAEAMAAAVGASGRPMVVHSMHAGGEPLAALRAGGVPVHDDVERAVAALAATLPAPARRGVPALPPPAAPVADRGYAATRSLLEAAGVPFVPAATVTDAGAAARAAAAIGYPVALKALGLLHKSDAGGVILGIAGEDELRAAAAGLVERLRPPALSVERMAPLGDGLELIAGTSWEPRLGPLVMVGLGGIHAETLGDVRAALAPVDADGAEALLRSLRGHPLLLGARGRPALDVRACAEAVAALSRVAAAHPELAELEVNPLLALPEGALALDARAV
jgi:acyl-CoA synthetase (NDP forming)